jgi:LuxR family maltose regulon positive regulatory protein
VSTPISLRRNKPAVSGGLDKRVPPAALVETKLQPPRAGPQRITRARLDAMLVLASERLLTVIRAPGGFGKTTLASSWVEALRARGDAVAWLSLDADDNEPRRFLHYTIRALKQACPDIGKDSLGAVNAPLRSVLALLVNEIADCGDDLFLFLDDYHSITHPAIHGILGFLVQHAPANLRVVIISRAEPSLGLASLRARGTLLEIDAALLRFTRDETREFLGLTSGRPLESADVSVIHGLTEGWPAALRITSLSFGAGKDPAQLLRSLAGAPRSIGGFFDELCALYSKDALDFMTRTAILERLSPPLCAALTGRDDCAGMLVWLEGQQLVSVLGSDGPLYAYHQLFREYLLQGLERDHSDAVADLHRRASAWYEAQESWSESVKHLLAAGDTAMALVSIERCAESMVQSGDMLTLLGWEQQLRSKLIQRPLQLDLAITWAKTLSLSRDEASQQIDAIERSIGDGAIGSDAIRRECLALRLVTTGLADQHARILELARDFHPQPGDRDFVGDAAFNAIRFAHAMSADWQALYSVPRVVRPVAGDRASVLTAIYESFALGIAEFSQARAAQAEQHFVTCMELGREVRGFAGATRLAAGPYAELLYETGRLEAAGAMLRDEVELADGAVSLDSALRTLVTAARIAWRGGRAEQAHGLLEHAEAIGLTRDWPRLVSAALFERLRLHLRAGRHTPALGLLRRLQQTRESAGKRTVRGVADVAQFCCLGQALVDIAQSRQREAARELAPLFAESRSCGAHLLAIRAGSILAVAQLQARNVAAARRTLGDVLELAEPSGLVGSIADAGPEIATIVSDLDRQRAVGATTAVRLALVEKLRTACSDVWGDAANEMRARAHNLGSLLSPREREILSLIAEGQSNKAIARRLGLGPETVKTHLKNVFAKLGVERRTQAVVRAEELGLVRVPGPV